MTAEARNSDPTHANRVGAAPPELTAEDASKDRFFAEIANISNAMIAAHGPDFAMGALILAARFIAEKKSFSKPAAEAGCCGGVCQETGHHHHHKS